MALPNDIVHPPYNLHLLPPICLPHLRGYLFFSPLDVEYFEAENNISWVFTAGSPGKYIISVRLHQIEESLCGPLFCRIHKSFIVCLRHVREMDPDKTSIMLDNGTWLPIGRAYQKQFLERMIFCK